MFVRFENGGLHVVNAMTLGRSSLHRQESKFTKQQGISWGEL